MRLHSRLFAILSLILILLVILICGCVEKKTSEITTPTPTEITALTPTPTPTATPVSTVTEKKQELRRNIIIDGDLGDVKSIGVEPVLTESRLGISDSANPKNVYIFTDGEWVYMGIELYGKMDKKRNYVLDIVCKENGEEKMAFNIKYEPIVGFIAARFVKTDGEYKFVEKYETYGAYKDNVIEIVSKCFSDAKDCNFVSFIVTYPSEKQFEYEKVIFKGKKLDMVIPFVKFNFSPESGIVESKAWEIHKRAWKDVVEKAKTDKYFKYAIYASRVLAVKHPEVYLQADKLFINKITTNKGFRKSYETKDVHSKYLFGKEKMIGEPFSFELVDFSKYKLISSRDIYPANYPVFGYIDRRLSPISVTLKTYNNEITELENVVQLYFKEKGQSKYIIYCDNDRAYLWEDGKLVDANLSTVDRVEGNPILIFNENYVWYPLMERDDTLKNSELKTIVEKYSTGVNTPKLSDFESEIVEKLKIVTEFENEKQKEMAKFLSIRAGIKYFYNDWVKEFPEIANHETTYYILKEIIKDGDYLSPITAYLSAIVVTKGGLDGVRDMCNEYLNHASTNGVYAHGHLWKCSMIEYLVEDSYRAKTGHCVVQAANLMAVLNLAGVECYRLSAVSTQNIGHDWLYIPEYDVILSNGNINRFNKVLWVSKGGAETNVIRFISYKDIWSQMMPYDYYAGTMSPEMAVEVLKYLKGLHNETMYGGKRIGKEWITIPFDELIKNIESKKYTWTPLTLS